MSARPHDPPHPAPRRPHSGEPACSRSLECILVAEHPGRCIRRIVGACVYYVESAPELRRAQTIEMAARALIASDRLMSDVPAGPEEEAAGEATDTICIVCGGGAPHDGTDDDGCPVAALAAALEKS